MLDEDLFLEVKLNLNLDNKCISSKDIRNPGKYKSNTSKRWDICNSSNQSLTNRIIDRKSIF